MTAQNIIDEAKDGLTGIKAAEDDAKLLRFLNAGKNRIAKDTLLWLGGEEILMTTATDYTLASMPIQILDIYTEGLTLLDRNRPTTTGYYQVAPNAIKVNTPNSGEKLYLNYYTTPADYILTDTVDFPDVLLECLVLFVQSKAFKSQRTEKELISSNMAMKEYKLLLEEYKADTDSTYIESVQEVDVVKQKGFV